MQKRAVVTGFNSGLGKLIYEGLRTRNFLVHGVDYEFENNVCDPYIFNGKLPFDGEKIDVLVNCAGTNAIARIRDMNSDDFTDIMDANVFGIFNMVQSLFNQLDKGGTVCNIVSTAARQPMRYSSAYNASKAAAEMLTRQMARELSEYGITVFGVSPNWMSGTTMTERTFRQLKEIRGWTDEDIEKAQTSTLAGELTPPEHVAEFVCWLLEEKHRNKYLTGGILEYGV